MGGLLSGFAQWLLSVLLYIPQKVWELLLDGLSAMISAIPAPAFLSGLQTAFGALPGDVLYVLGLMQAQYGVPLIASAYVLRWILRRIPLIG